MSVYVESHDVRVPKDARSKVMARIWIALILLLAVAIAMMLPSTSVGRKFLALYKQPLFWLITGVIVFQFVGVAVYAFMYPQNRKSIGNRFLLACLSVFLLPAFAFGMHSDVARYFGQTGIAVQQCFGPAAASFKSSAIPQLACLQAWDEPYAVVERRKIAEFGQKECLRQEDEKISANIERAVSQFNAFDTKEKVLAAFRANNVPLETSDGQSYFANITTHCLDSAGYDKNSQFKVVILASFTAGSLIRDLTVSSSNASIFNSVFAKNGIAESYKVDFETKRRVASAAQSLSGLFASKSKAVSGAPNDVSLSNLTLSCANGDDACVSGATLSGTLLNRSSNAVREVSIAWGVYRDGQCDQSMTEAQTVSFGSDAALGEREQRSFALSLKLPRSIDVTRIPSLCGSVSRVN